MTILAICGPVSNTLKTFRKQFLLSFNIELVDAKLALAKKALTEAKNALVKEDVLKDNFTVLFKEAKPLPEAIEHPTSSLGGVRL